MMTKNENKHDRFLRLAQNRLGRTLEALRLVSQLSSRRYENTPEEATEVVRLLDEAVRRIAEAFRVEYATRIGKAASQTTAGARAIGVMLKRPPILDEVECMRTIEHIRAGRTDEAISILRSAIAGGGVA